MKKNYITFESKEYFSLSALNYIITHFFELAKNHKDIHPSYMKLLLNLKKDLNKRLSFDKNGFCIKMLYVNSNLVGGRLFATKMYSLQKIDRRLRGALVLNNSLYYDIDMVNAQFNILVFYCIKNNIECFFLKDYAENRDSIFKRYFSNTVVTKDEFKQNFCRVMFFGTNLAKQKDFLKDKSFENFFTSFKEEIYQIFKKIVTLEKDLYILHKTRFKKQSKNGSFFALFLQNIERNILLSAIQITKDFLCLQTNSFALIHDGFMVPKFLFSNEKDLNNLLKEINEKINMLYRYPFVFTQKFMNTSLIDDATIEHLYKEDVLTLQNKFSLLKKRRKKLRSKVSEFISVSISYGDGEKNYYTVKNVEWLFQIEVDQSTKSIDVLHELKSLVGFQKPIQKRLDNAKVNWHCFVVKSKNSRVLFLFDQIKNKNNLSEKKKAEIIKSLEVYNDVGKQ